MILLLFGSKMLQQAISKPVSNRVAKTQKATELWLIGLHSKDHKREYLMAMLFLVFSQLDHNAIGLNSLRYEYLKHDSRWVHNLV